MAKQIIICADDFAQNLEISEGILLLARDKRICAVSCMVNSPHWDEVSKDLSAIDFPGYIGLHVNLTHGQALSSMWRKHEGDSLYPLPVLIKKLYLQKIDLATIQAEVQAQIDVFANHMHFYPDFIDGHQHVQQLPGVRDALFAIHKQFMARAQHDDHEPVAAFFRNTSNGKRDYVMWSGFPKPQILRILGGKKFRDMLIDEQIPTNASFSGVYNFQRADNYRKYFQRFLAASSDGGMIMCHPGCHSLDISDPLHKSRHHELTYLLSDMYLTDIEDSLYRLAFKNG